MDTGDGEKWMIMRKEGICQEGGIKNQGQKGERERKQIRGKRGKNKGLMKMNSSGLVEVGF